MTLPMLMTTDPFLDRRVHLLPQTRRLHALHTVIRDRDAGRADFVLHAEQIFRLLLDAGMDLLPFEPHTIRTPVGRAYEGIRLAAPLYGVSVVRAGESMEGAMRELYPSVRIGKILIQRNKITKLPKLYLSILPPEIERGFVFLLEPMLATGGSARAAVQVLLDHGVKEERIVFINLICVPEGLRTLLTHHPGVQVVTSAIDERLDENAFMMPGIGDFGDRFYGTDVSVPSANLCGAVSRPG